MIDITHDGTMRRRMVIHTQQGLTLIRGETSGRFHSLELYAHAEFGSDGARALAKALTAWADQYHPQESEA